jgi:hypothetical protein
MTKNVISGTKCFLTVLIFTSCLKKDVKLNSGPVSVNVELQSGFGQYYKKINGFFFVACVAQKTSSVYTKGDISGWAAVRDPAGDLMKSFNHNSGSRGQNDENRGNISVGKVTFNDKLVTNLSFTPVSEYQINDYTDFDFKYGAKWSIQGNGAFEGFTQKLDSFASIILTPGVGTLSVNQPFTVNVKNAVRKYDSVSVVFSAQRGRSVQKSVGAPDSLVSFSSGEIMDVISDGSSEYYLLTYNAYRYFNTTVNGKIYVFELATRMSKSLRPR